MSIPTVTTSSPHQLSPQDSGLQPERRRAATDESTGVQTQKLTLQLDSAVTSSQSLPELLQHLARIIQDQTDSIALWFSVVGEGGSCDSFRPVPDQNDNSAWSVVEELVRFMVPQALESRQLCSTACQSNSQVIVVPIRHQTSPDAHPGAVWVGCFATENQTAVRQQWLMNMVGQATTAWFQRRSQITLEKQTQQLNDLLAAMITLNQADSVSNASIVLVNHLRRTLSSSQVAVCLANGPDHFTLSAVSDIEKIDEAAESAAFISNACQASSETGQPVAYPPASPDSNSDSAPTENQALQKYCQVNGVEACLSLPLKRADGTLCATLLVATTSAQLQDESAMRHCLNVAEMLGSHFDTIQRANRGTGRIILDEIQKVKSSGLTRKMTLATGILALLLCIPLPYRVACDCTIQPVVRRYVAAPYDGILDSSKVKAGDVVSAGQLLAEMDAGNLRMELSGVQAELSAARKRRDSALAQGEVAQSQIAGSEMRRHQSQIDLLNQQLANLEIRSPIDGLVVHGDLEKAEGAPLEMGQTVFEIAPLDQMLAEIAIEESEIQYVTAGMPVKIKLNAFPFKSWTGVVRNINPGTEVVNDESVFVAEVELPNAELQLKPGMEGSSKIRGNYATLGWSLFHRPWESVRCWMVW